MTRRRSKWTDVEGTPGWGDSEVLISRAVWVGSKVPASSAMRRDTMGIARRQEYVKRQCREGITVSSGVYRWCSALAAAHPFIEKRLYEWMVFHWSDRIDHWSHDVSLWCDSSIWGVPMFSIYLRGDKKCYIHMTAGVSRLIIIDVMQDRSSWFNLDRACFPLSWWPHYVRSNGGSRHVIEIYNSPEARGDFLRSDRRKELSQAAARSETLTYSCAADDRSCPIYWTVPKLFIPRWMINPKVWMVVP